VVVTRVGRAFHRRANALKKELDVNGDGIVTTKEVLQSCYRSSSARGMSAGLLRPRHSNHGSNRSAPSADADSGEQRMVAEATAKGSHLPNEESDAPSGVANSDVQNGALTREAMGTSLLSQPVVAQLAAPAQAGVAACATSRAKPATAAPARATISRLPNIPSTPQTLADGVLAKAQLDSIAPELRAQLTEMVESEVARRAQDSDPSDPRVVERSASRRKRHTRRSTSRSRELHAADASETAIEPLSGDDASHV
jgi:hypothetical protein